MEWVDSTHCQGLRQVERASRNMLQKKEEEEGSQVDNSNSQLDQRMESRGSNCLLDNLPQKEHLKEQGGCIHNRQKWERRVWHTDLLKLDTNRKKDMVKKKGHKKKNAMEELKKEEQQEQEWEQE
jgi:hypothetical protein